MKKRKKLNFFNPTLMVDTKVAIVGSSSSILKMKNGTLIDTFDEIIRFNRGITLKYEEYVGSKTTLRIINNNVFFRIPESGNEFFLKDLNSSKLGVIAPFKINQEDKKKFLLNNHEYFFFNTWNAKVKILIYFLTFPKIFLKLVNLIYSKKQLSVGFLTILAFITSKIKPTLFGFDLNEDMSKRSHYYVKNWPIGGRHDFKSEHLIIQLLKEKNLVDIVI